jgi:biopolymer transport protein ExbD
MKKRKGFLKRAPATDQMELQITSMADVFVIILVFLLKSYSTGMVNVQPAAGLVLPDGKGAEAELNALKLEVSQTGVLVEGQPATQLKDYVADKGDLQSNGTLKSLSTALEKERKRQLLIAKANSDVKVDARILVVADQHVPYSTLKSVLASAATQGYTDFKLAVIRGD